MHMLTLHLAAVLLVAAAAWPASAAPALRPDGYVYVQSIFAGHDCQVIMICCQPKCLLSAAHCFELLLTGAQSHVDCPGVLKVDFQ